MSGWPDVYEPFRQLAREGWRRLSPYRLGIIIGEHGGGLLNRAKQSRME